VRRVVRLANARRDPATVRHGVPVAARPLADLAGRGSALGGPGSTTAGLATDLRCDPDVVLEKSPELVGILGREIDRVLLTVQGEGHGFTGTVLDVLAGEIVDQLNHYSLRHGAFLPDQISLRTRSPEFIPPARSELSGST